MAVAKKPKLKPVQETAIMMLIYENKTQKQVAHELGLSTNTVSLWNKNELYTKTLEEEVKRKFKRASTDAQNTLIGLLDSSNEFVKLNACKDILSRSGYDATIKQEIKETIIEVDIEE